MQCLYCQNYQISHRKGRLESSPSTLHQVTAEIMKCIDKGIEAVGFVSPMHHSPHVKAIIKQLNSNGYTPITVYNTNGFDKVEIIRSFEGLIDVYLPDFKNMNPFMAEQFSDTGEYPDLAKKALLEMYRQKGSTVVLNENGQAVTGLIIRHLLLPGQVKDSISILEWIAGELSPSVSISLMSQYYPTACVVNHPLLGRKITAEEYQEVLDAMNYLGFHKGWIQECSSSGTYKPDFSNEHPFV
jgi:putative pyruvate formate lyase activating enzyme